MNNNKFIFSSRAARFFLAALFVFIFVQNTFAQSKNKGFFKLSCPEKRWVLTHIFIAKGAYNISLEATKKAVELKNDTSLDGDLNGGHLDAFRHCYWMSRITQKYGWRAARALGKAHEKGNYKDYKKHRTEEGTIPDAQSSQMDFLNNDVGIEVGKSNPGIQEEQLTILIKNLILSGKLFVIKKDRLGNFLTCDGKIITATDLKGKWETLKCVLPSSTLNNFN